MSGGVGEAFGFFLVAFVFGADDDDGDRGVLKTVFAYGAGEEAGYAAERAASGADDEAGWGVDLDLWKTSALS